MFDRTVRKKLFCHILKNEKWDLCQNLLDQYGLGLDIVYDDPEFPVAEKYPQIYYWNHTIPHKIHEHKDKI